VTSGYVSNGRDPSRTIGDRKERIAGGDEQMMAAMKSTGRGDLDHAGLVTLIEELAKTELRKKRLLKQRS
jgi:hypothetical protein